jgi:phosphate transport system substrate-binding protein
MMKTLSFAFVAMFAVAAPVSAQQITGAGATFPAPVYAKWGEAAKAAVGIELNYQAIGSGRAEPDFQSDGGFRASDAPVDAPKLVEQKLLQFPSVMGAVVPVVNIPGVELNKLKLTGDVSADIYGGQDQQVE